MKLRVETDRRVGKRPVLTWTQKQSGEDQVGGTYPDQNPERGRRGHPRDNKTSILTH